MKKLLMGSVVLTAFAISISLIQMSCSKEALAQGNSTSQIGKVIFKKMISNGGAEIWTCNYDGTSAAKVNITLPSGVTYSDDMNPVISPNGQKIFFTAGATGSFKGDLYNCNTDGSSVTKIHDRAGGNIILGAAY
jgi:Tol biopolymer transport system component